MPSVQLRYTTTNLPCAAGMDGPASALRTLPEQQDRHDLHQPALVAAGGVPAPRHSWRNSTAW